MITLILLSTLIICIFKYYRNRYSYWKTSGVPTLSNQHFLFGDITKTILGQENFITTIDKAYNEFKSRGCKFGGIYSLNNPMLLTIHPDFTRRVLVKDAEYFIDRGVDYNEETHPLSGNMFNLGGDDWKIVRRKTSPTFTTGKLKTMYWIIEEKVDKLCEVIKKKIDEDIYLMDLNERTGMDIIGQLAFAQKCNVLEKETSPFVEATSKLFRPTLWCVLKVAFKHIFKNHANMSLITIDDPNTNNFFVNIIGDMVKYRKENKIHVNDLIQSLIELMEPKDGEKGLSLNRVAAQAFVLFIAGYETGAKALNMIMYELGKNKELQDNVRREVLEVLEKHGGKFSYEMVSECSLLDIVAKENYRKNPPVVFLNRICVKNYKVPGTSVEIEAGTPVIIPVYSFHHDPNNFSNPELFDENRFTKENEGNIKPHTYMPFGEGPRFCIGNRLGQYQLKTSVMKLLQHFEFSVSSKTEEPLSINRVTENLLLTFKQKIFFKFKNIYNNTVI